MKLPQSLLKKTVNLHFANSQIYKGTVDNCCKGYYRIDIVDDVTGTRAMSGHFRPNRITEYGDDFVKFDFYAP